MATPPLPLGVAWALALASGCAPGPGEGLDLLLTPELAGTVDQGRGCPDLALALRNAPQAYPSVWISVNAGLGLVDEALATGTAQSGEGTVGAGVFLLAGVGGESDLCTDAPYGDLLQTLDGVQGTVLLEVTPLEADCDDYRPCALVDVVIEDAVVMRDGIGVPVPTLELEGIEVWPVY